jgi:hypothetical protein
LQEFEEEEDSDFEAGSGGDDEVTATATQLISTPEAADACEILVTAAAVIWFLAGAGAAAGS